MGLAFKEENFIIWNNFDVICLERIVTTYMEYGNTHYSVKKEQFERNSV